MRFDYLNYVGIKLKWWQKLYLLLLPCNYACFYKYSNKTGLHFMLMLDKLKRKAKTDEERKYYEQIQKEWGAFCTGLNLGYWK